MAQGIYWLLTIPHHQYVPYLQPNVVYVKVRFFRLLIIRVRSRSATTPDTDTGSFWSSSTAVSAWPPSRRLLVTESMPSFPVRPRQMTTFGRTTPPSMGQDSSLASSPGSATAPMTGTRSGMTPRFGSFGLILGWQL